MTELRFFAVGIPAPQGSKRHVGNGVMVESSKALKPWRSDVMWQAIDAKAQQNWVTPTDSVSLAATFYLPRPASVSVKKRRDPSVKPDLDKLLRGLLDALTAAQVVRDDAQFVSIFTAKFYADQGGNLGVDVTVFA